MKARLFMVLLLFVLLLPLALAETPKISATEKAVIQSAPGEEVDVLVVIKPDTQAPLEAKTLSKKNLAIEAKALEAEPKARAYNEAKNQLSQINAKVVKKYSGMSLFHVKISKNQLEQLEQMENVLKIEPNYKVSAFLDASVPTVKASTFWDANIEGDRANVAIVDSGIKTTHNNLKDTNRGAARSFESYDFSDDSDIDDLHGHGTHVTGIIASTINATYGTRGVAPSIPHLINAKHLNSSGESTASRAKNALEWAVLTASPSANILNNSWGTGKYYSNCTLTGLTPDGSYSSSLYVDFLADAQNTVQVIAAGNEGSCSATDSLGSPADSYNGITVAASNDQGTHVRGDDTVYAHSSRGPTSDGRKKPDLMVPGENIHSTYTDSDTSFETLSGTSMAAPHVVGAAALLWSAGITNAMAVKAILINSAEDWGDSGWDKDTGWGYLDLNKAYYDMTYFDVNSIRKNSTKLYNIECSSGDKATIVWNRHLNDEGTAAFALSDLNIYLYDKNTSLVDSSVSAVDNVEQVVCPRDANFVLAVKAQSNDFDGSIEDKNFAIAFSSAFIRLDNNATYDNGFALDLNVSRAFVDRNTTIDFNFSLQNLDAFTAFDVNVEIIMPTDFNLLSGDLSFDANGFILPIDINYFSFAGQFVDDGNKAVRVIIDHNSYDFNYVKYYDFNFIVDSNAPELGASAFTGWKNDSNLHISCNDTLSGCIIKYRLDSDDSNNVSLGSWLDYDANIYFERDGNYAIDFNLVDYAGNSIDLNWVYYTFETIAPQTTDDHNAGWQAIDQNTGLSCSDQNSGCASTKYRLNSGTWLDYNAGGILLQDGNVRIDYNSTDAVGNIESTHSIWVAVDKVVPTISSPGPSGTQTSSSVTLAATTSENCLCKYSATDSNYASMTSTFGSSYTTSHSAGLSGLSNASYNYYVRCVDRAGNESSTATISFTVSVSTDSTTTDTSNTTTGSPTGTPSGSPSSGSTDTTTMRDDSKSYEGSSDDVESVLAEAGIDSAEEVQGFKEATKKFKVTRKVKVTKTTTYTTTFTLNVSNNTPNDWKDVKIVEVVPKDVAPKASQISSPLLFKVLKDDPVLEFTIDSVAPNSAASVSYSVNYWNKTPLAEFSAPALSGEEIIDLCRDKNCDDSNPCTVDSCSEGNCAHSNEVDGAVCDENKVCELGACVPGQRDVNALSAQVGALEEPLRFTDFLSSFVYLGNPWTKMAFFLVIFVGSIVFAIMSLLKLRSGGFSLRHSCPKGSLGDLEKTVKHQKKIKGKKVALFKKKMGKRKK